MIQDFQLPLFTLKEQKQIVKELDELSGKTKELEIIYRRKITDLEELKKSYLQEAFAGKL
jgi:type I restriction enzyme S subunit